MHLQMMGTGFFRALTITLAGAWSVRAAEPPKAAAILKEHCLHCHNSSTRMSGLSLATVADARKGGLHGPAIMPGKPGESLVMQMISGDKPKMPMQSAPLSAAQVAEIRAWIEQGAPWPEDLSGDRQKSDLWSLAPLMKPAIPSVRSSRVRTPIDAFILAK